MESQIKWVSRQKLLTLKLESVSYDGTVKFTFRDRLNNLYEHYQVLPSEAASQSKAALFFKGISNGECRCLDFTQMREDPNDKLLEPLTKYVGHYYACVVRKKVMSDNRFYLNVESLFYNFPMTDGDKFVNCKAEFLHSDSYKEDPIEMMRLAKKYKKQIKRGKLC